MNAMQTHVRVLAILHIVFGVLGVLIGVVVFALFGGVAALVQDASNPSAVAIPVMNLWGGIVLIVALAVSLPGLIAGIGLLSYRPWARAVTIVVSILELMNFPFGTALGVYGMWVLLTADGARLFEQRPLVQRRGLDSR